MSTFHYLRGGKTSSSLITNSWISSPSKWTNTRDTSIDRVSDTNIKENQAQESGLISNSRSPAKRGGKKKMEIRFFFFLGVCKIIKGNNTIKKIMKKKQINKKKKKKLMKGSFISSQVRIKLYLKARTMIVLLLLYHPCKQRKAGRTVCMRRKHTTAFPDSTHFNFRTKFDVTYAFTCLSKVQSMNYI